LVSLELRWCTIWAFSDSRDDKNFQNTKYFPHFGAHFDDKKQVVKEFFFEKLNERSLKTFKKCHTTNFFENSSFCNI